MGFLHEGHLSLVKRAKKENDRVVVSIFVNPTQFGPKEDFSSYPRNEKQDFKLLREVGCDFVFAPRSPQEVYPVGGDVLVQGRKSLTEALEGKFRPGHFDGVTTVVLKLFHLVAPEKAYFGEKDYQQLQVIRAMVSDLFLPVKVVACKTFREKTGLAMSSRNSYFSSAEREKAAALHRVLKDAKTPLEAKRALKKAGFQIDYVEAWSDDLDHPSRDNRGRWLAAVRWAGVRLIDNLKK